MSRRYTDVCTTTFKGGWRGLELCEFKMEITSFQVLRSEWDIIQDSFE